MTPWTWTILELMSFKFANKMIEIARKEPYLTDDQLHKKTVAFFCNQ